MMEYLRPVWMWLSAFTPFAIHCISRLNSFLYCLMILSGHRDWKYAMIDLISRSLRRSPKDGIEPDPSGDPPLVILKSTEGGW